MIAGEAVSWPLAHRDAAPTDLFEGETAAFLARSSAHDRPLLLIGEPGVGKERLARAIHSASARAAGPFCVVEADGHAPSDVEAAIFGEPGHPGALEAAAGGTLFIAEGDRAGERVALRLALALRAASAGDPTKGPRIVLTRTRAPAAGAIQPARLDTTGERRRRGRSLGRILEADAFTLAPLRERTAELPRLVERLLARSLAARGRSALPLEREDHGWLAAQPYPGNLRELALLLDRLVAEGGGSLGSPAPLRTPSRVMKAARPMAAPVADPPLRERIVSALTACAFNQSRAARQLGMSRRTLLTRLDELGITRPVKRPLK